MPKPDTLLVKAGPNGLVHFEGTKIADRRLDPETGLDTYGIGNAPVEVENTRYYRRRLAVGDLVLVTPAAPKGEK